MLKLINFTEINKYILNIKYINNKENLNKIWYFHTLPHALNLNKIKLNKLNTWSYSFYVYVAICFKFKKYVLVVFIYLHMEIQNYNFCTF